MLRRIYNFISAFFLSSDDDVLTPEKVENTLRKQDLDHDSALKLLNDSPNFDSYQPNWRNFCTIAGKWKDVAEEMLKKFNYSSQDLREILNFSKFGNLKIGSNDLFEEILNRVASKKLGPEEFELRFADLAVPIIKHAIVSRCSIEIFDSLFCGEASQILYPNRKPIKHSPNGMTKLFEFIDLACDQNNPDLAFGFVTRYNPKFFGQDYDLVKSIFLKSCSAKDAQFDKLCEAFIARNFIYQNEDLFQGLICAKDSGRDSLYKKISTKIKAVSFLNLLLSHAQESRWDQCEKILEYYDGQNQNGESEIVAARVFSLLNKNNAPNEIKDKFLVKTKIDSYQVAALLDVQDANLIYDTLPRDENGLARPNSEIGLIDIYYKIFDKIEVSRLRSEDIGEKYQTLFEQLSRAFSKFISPKTKERLFCENCKKGLWNRAEDILEQIDKDFFVKDDCYKAFKNLLKSGHGEYDSLEKDKIFDKILNEANFDEEKIFEAMAIVSAKNDRRDARFFEKLAEKYLSISTPDNTSQAILDSSKMVLDYCYSSNCELIDHSIRQGLVDVIESSLDKKKERQRVIEFSLVEYLDSDPYLLKEESPRTTVKKPLDEEIDLVQRFIDAATRSSKRDLFRYLVE